MKLIIVGGGPPALVAQVQREADLDPRVVLTGPLFGEELRKIFSNAALFVLPSILEGLPIALIEALSYDLPVVVSDIEENLEVVRDGDGYRATVTRAGDVGSLHDGLEIAIDTIARAGKRSGNANFVAEKYNWDRVTEQTLVCYQAALVA